MSVTLVTDCRMFSSPDLTRKRKSSAVSKSSVHAQMMDRASRANVGTSANRYCDGSGDECVEATGD